MLVQSPFNLNLLVLLSELVQVVLLLYIHVGYSLVNFLPFVTDGLLETLLCQSIPLELQPSHLSLSIYVHMYTPLISLSSLA